MPMISGRGDYNFSPLHLTIGDKIADSTLVSYRSILKVFLQDEVENELET